MRFLPLLLGVVDVLELIEVHGVHLEVGHVHLVFHLFGRFGLQIVSPILSFLDQRVNILVAKLVTHPENTIGSVIDHVLHLFLPESLLFGGQTALLDDHRVEFQLESLSFDHLLLHGVDSDEAENLDDLGLTDSVRAVHGLEIDLGVPVRVIKDDCIGCHQVQTKATSPSRNEKYLLGGAWLDKFLNLLLSILQSRVAI